MRKAPGRLLCPIYARASEGIRGGRWRWRQTGLVKKTLWAIREGCDEGRGKITGRKWYFYIAELYENVWLLFFSGKNIVASEKKHMLFLLAQKIEYLSVSKGHHI